MSSQEVKEAARPAASMGTSDPTAPLVEKPSDDSFLAPVLEQTLPSMTSAALNQLLAETMPTADNGRYEIAVAGRFCGSDTTDLLAYAMQSKRSGALVIVERDAERVLYFAKGKLVGSASTELFERIGRLLYSSEVVTRDDSKILVKAEKQLGSHALLLWLSSQQLEWSVERRVWEVAASIHLIKRGHFAFIEGKPQIEGPNVALSPVDVAAEAKRRYDEWRSGTQDTDKMYQPPAMRELPPKLGRKLLPIDIGPSTLQGILERIREAETRAP